MGSPVKRSYDSSRRQDQARRNRARMRDAATALFTEHGYAATSIAAIAAEAGVAPQTVYAAFGTKANLLVEAIGVAMAGDDEPVAVFDREDARRALEAETPAEAAAAIAAVSSRLLERASGLIEAAEDAARGDAELAQLAVEGQKLRYGDMKRVARSLRASGLLAPALTVDQATDLLFVLASPDTYRTLTRHRGWTATRYERWLRDTIAHSVLRD